MAARDALLAALQQLGMRSAVTTSTLLDSARYVERLQATSPDAACLRCCWESTAPCMHLP